MPLFSLSVMKIQQKPARLGKDCITTRFFLCVYLCYCPLSALSGVLSNLSSCRFSILQDSFPSFQPDLMIIQKGKWHQNEIGNAKYLYYNRVTNSTVYFRKAKNQQSCSYNYLCNLSCQMLRVLKCWALMITLLLFPWDLGNHLEANW